MTSKEAYNMDLDELRTAIDALLAAVPSSTKRSDAHRREEAERVASSARALIGCMSNDYIIAESPPRGRDTGAANRHRANFRRNTK